MCDLNLYFGTDWKSSQATRDRNYYRFDYVANFSNMSVSGALEQFGCDNVTKKSRMVEGRGLDWNLLYAYTVHTLLWIY